MTIKQQGGIFGRNPTFQDVTIEGSLSFDGAVDVTTDLTIDGTLTADGLAINDGTSLLARTSSGAEIDVLEVRNNATATSTASAIKFVNSTATGSNSGSTELVAIRTGTNTGDFKIRTSNSSATMTDRMLIGSNGNISISAGNLVIGTSGKGIDFSATSGTGTSELFDDYEEGTFTPTLEASGGGAPSSYSTRVGSYTKIGDTVYILINLAVHAGTLSGDIKVTGLPFSPSESSSIYTAAYRRWNTTFVSYGLIDSGTSAVRIIKSTNNAISETPVTNSDMLLTANRNSLIISGCYRTT